MARQRNIPVELTDQSRGTRLQKVIADAGVASRREAETMIAEGRVTVNGQFVLELPAWVDPMRDRVEVDGKPLKRPRKNEPAQAPIYIALNKPKRVVSTTDDPEGRRTVLDLVELPQGLTGRIYPVGRLDYDSMGLILLTNDGELANRLTHPRYEVTKEYSVTVAGKLSDEDVDRLKRGLLLAHRGSGKSIVQVKRAKMTAVSRKNVPTDRARGERTRLNIVLREGQNREIRRLLARLGLKVRKLERVAIGPLTSRGIRTGDWRMLTGAEVNALYRAAGGTRDAKKTDKKSGRSRKPAGKSATPGKKTAKAGPSGRTSKAGSAARQVKKSKPKGSSLSTRRRKGS